MMENPFINRRPVEDPQEFIGRRAQVNEVLRLLGAVIPQCCYVVGDGRIGKTSFVRYIAHPEGGQKLLASMLPRQCQWIFVYLDLEMLGSNKRSRQSDDPQLAFFRLMLHGVHRAVLRSLPQSERELLKKCDEIVKSMKQERAYISPAFVIEQINEYLEILFEDAPVDRRLVIVLDEADTIIRTGIGYVLRSFLRDRPLGYLLAARKPLHELDPEEQRSPLYGLCTHITLGSLMQEEAEELVARLADSAAAVRFSEEDFAYIQELGGRHPDFLKVAAQHIFDARLHHRSDAPNNWYRMIAVDLERTCNGIWNATTELERNVLVAIAESYAQSLSSAPTTRALCQRGILIEQDDGFDRRMQIFSPIFSEYIRSRRKSSTSPISSIDPKGMLALVFGEGIIEYQHQKMPVTKLEQQILLVLSERRGNIYSREQLYTSAWQNGPYSEDVVDRVNVAIQRLREKLHTYLDDKLVIESVRGKGYRIRAPG